MKKALLIISLLLHIETFGDDKIEKFYIIAYSKNMCAEVVANDSLRYRNLNIKFKVHRYEVSIHRDINRLLSMINLEHVLLFTLDNSANNGTILTTQLFINKKATEKFEKCPKFTFSVEHFDLSCTKLKDELFEEVKYYSENGSLRNIFQIGLIDGVNNHSKKFIQELNKLCLRFRVTIYSNSSAEESPINIKFSNNNTACLNLNQRKRCMNPVELIQYIEDHFSAKKVLIPGDRIMYSDVKNYTPFFLSSPHEKTIAVLSRRRFYGLLCLQEG